MAKNIYKHTIDLKTLDIRNAPREDFAKQIIAIEYRGYEVEQCADGRKIVISKPGGKRVFGHSKKEDMLVFIFDPKDNSLWQISHKQILEDVTDKCTDNPSEGRKLLSLLKRVYDGEEPNDFIDEIRALSFHKGECSEELIKAYKWIWGQEDVNYPDGAGRSMSWKEYEMLMKKL